MNRPNTYTNKRVSPSTADLHQVVGMADPSVCRVWMHESHIVRSDLATVFIDRGGGTEGI